MSFLANHSAVFHPDHQTTEFRQTTKRGTVVDPSHRVRERPAASLETEARGVVGYLRTVTYEP